MAVYWLLLLSTAPSVLQRWESNRCGCGIGPTWFTAGLMLRSTNFFGVGYSLTGDTVGFCATVAGKTLMRLF